MTSRRPSADTGATMSHEAERWARAQTVGNSTAKAVLKELAFRMNGETGLCYPSVKTLCKDLEIKKDETVLNALVRLESLGLISRTLERGERGNIIRTLFSFPTFNPEEWKVVPQKSEDGCSEKRSTGTPKIGAGYSEKRGTVLRKSGEWYSENRSVTGNVEQGKEQVTEPIASAASASASEPTLFPEVDQPKPKKSRRKPQVPCPWKPGTPIPDHLKEWAAENYPTLNAEQVFQEFIGWMIAKDVRNAVWDQAFRNWMANELKKQAKRGGQSWQTKTRPASQWAPSGSTPTKYISPEKQREIDEWYAKQQAEAALLVG